MAAKLTDEQRNDIAANPRQAIPVVDEQDNKVYYLVDEAFLLGAAERDEQSRQRLLALIREGFDGEEVSAEEGETRIRRKMQSITDKTTVIRLTGSLARCASRIAGKRRLTIGRDGFERKVTECTEPG
jgi:hypothetical protein